MGFIDVFEESLFLLKVSKGSVHVQVAVSGPVMRQNIMEVGICGSCLHSGEQETEKKEGAPCRFLVDVSFSSFGKIPKSYETIG